MTRPSWSREVPWPSERDVLDMSPCELHHLSPCKWCTVMPRAIALRHPHWYSTRQRLVVGLGDRIVAVAKRSESYNGLRLYCTALALCAAYLVWCALSWTRPFRKE